MLDSVYLQLGMETLFHHSKFHTPHPNRHRAPRLFVILLSTALILVLGTTYAFGPIIWNSYIPLRQLPPQALASLSLCRSLAHTPPAPSVSQRTVSDRFVPGTRPHLLKNARVWTGNHNGTDVVLANILLDKGLIKGVGRISTSTLAAYRDDLVVIDLKGAWVTPGCVFKLPHHLLSLKMPYLSYSIVDLHSHLGYSSSPELRGASSDENSRKGPILPWLRALDSLNTHDDSYELSIAGGVTTALVLPGSANAIGNPSFSS